MAKCFGTWLRDYAGESERLKALSRKWQGHLRKDYLKACDYWSPEDVYSAMSNTYGDNPKLERLVQIAYDVNRNRLRATKTRFTSTAPAYRPDPDVPTWPPIWE